MVPTQTPWYATKKAINGYIIGGAVIVGLLILFTIIGSLNNTYVSKDQNVQTSESNISKESQRRVDLFNNLVDAVESAKTFEQNTQTRIAEARSQGNKGQVDEAMLTINAVAEAYPEIKSTKLYEQTMIEFSITENRLASYREQYNNDVRDFNGYVQGFPQSMFLPFVGKDTAPKKYLDYKVNDAEARDLFKKD